MIVEKKGLFLFTHGQVVLERCFPLNKGNHNKKNKNKTKHFLNICKLLFEYSIFGNLKYWSTKKPKRHYNYQSNFKTLEVYCDDLKQVCTLTFHFFDNFLKQVVRAFTPNLNIEVSYWYTRLHMIPLRLKYLKLLSILFHLWNAGIVHFHTSW